MNRTTQSLIYVILSLTTLSGLLLSSVFVSADDSVVDEINITVPISCTLSGTGQNSHNATINNGQYNSAIGETTLKAYCNDNEGFAIYAIGYTDNTDGSNVLTNSDLGSTYDIVTGTATSGNTSNWAMKLSTISSPAPTYPITIQNSFDSFQQVPDDYALVAKRTSNTDIGTNAEGSTLKTTYQTYISPTQPAGTYTGQVKYVLVHPNYVDETAMQNAVTVVFDGNGQTFSSGATTSTVKYTKVCNPTEYAYVGDTPTISKSDNLDNDGVPTRPIAHNDYHYDTVAISGADKLKIVLKYDFNPEGTTSGAYLYIQDSERARYYYGVGDEIITIDGDTIDFGFDVSGTVDTNHSYGYYAQVYPVYDQATAGATYGPVAYDCSIIAISGNYEPLNDSWKGTISGAIQEFAGEADLKDYIQKYPYTLAGTTINLTRGLTWDEAYANAGKTKTNNYYVVQDANSTICSNVGVGQHTSVLDNRDGTIYNISKLKDGNCWFLDNLALDLTNPSVQSVLSSSNTNASDTTLSYLIGTNTGTSLDQYAESAVTTTWSSSTNGYVIPAINKESKDLVPDNSNFGHGNHKVGIYYNYCAASAGSFCYNYTSSSTILNEDVCPSAWRIIGYSELGDLTERVYDLEYSEYYESHIDPGLPNGVRYNLSLNLSGIFWDDTAQEQGENGYLWTNQAANQVFYTALMGEGGHYSSWTMSRVRGLSVRCMLDS